ncbi:MAG TPA: tail fiber protein [Mycobacteriales bacterium]|jgi:microcystin-dependent protein|nr:tail fiber protein [Mycobacteriales bacterium]
MSQPYVGDIRIFAGTYAPAGWAFCNGQPLPISENEVLFQLIGTTYGGDGQETFNLPDLRGRLPMHQGSGFTLGEMAGTEEVTLTTQQIPVHNHAFLATTALAIETGPAGNVPAQGTSIQLFVEDATDVQMAASMVAPTGGNQPHTNLHPYLCVNFIIALYGVFPTQN